jgi:hypothetical protein
MRASLGYVRGLRWKPPDNAWCVLADGHLYRFCANAKFDVCNWLVDVAAARVTPAAAGPCRRDFYHLREPQKIPLVMSQDETRRLLAVASSLKVRILILLSLGYGCGLRPEAGCGLPGRMMPRRCRRW